MDETESRNSQGTEADEEAIREIPQRMIEAWNRGSGDAFASPFAETADFVAFEGTHLQGRQAIAEFHTRLFADGVKGTRIAGEAKFVRFLSPELAVMHAVARVALPGQHKPSPSRDSMQLFVVRKSAGRWCVESIMNARRLSLERQILLDHLDALAPEEQLQVENLLDSLRR